MVPEERLDQEVPSVLARRTPLFPTAMKVVPSEATACRAGPPLITPLVQDPVGSVAVA